MDGRIKNVQTVKLGLNPRDGVVRAQGAAARAVAR